MVDRRIEHLCGGICDFSGQLFVASLEQAKGNQRALFLFLGAALLLCSYGTYQPTAGFALLPLLANAWRGFNVDAARARTFFMGIAMILGVTVLYFLAYKILALVCRFGGQAQRTALASDILGNLGFVMTKVLWSGLTNWSQFNAPWVQCVTTLIVVVVISGGCTSKPWNSLRGQLPALACMAGAFFVAVLPLLVVKERLFAFRTQTALHAVMGLLFIIGLENWCRRILQTAMGKNLLFALIITLAAGATHFHLNRDFVQFNVHEAEVLTKGMEQFHFFPTNMVFTTPPQAMLRKDGVVAEFRYPTSPWVWSAPSMLEILLIQLYENQVPLRVALQRHADFTVRYGPANPDGLPLLDGFSLFTKGPLQEVHDPYWGTIRVAQNGWCISDWFGVFDNNNFPSVYQCQLGWLYCVGKGGDDLWLFSERYGWLWTNPKSFPSMLVKHSDTWFWLSPEIRDPLFVNLKDKSWTVSP